jgi:hypothetical protein
VFPNKLKKYRRWIKKWIKLWARPFTKRRQGATNTGRLE